MHFSPASSLFLPATTCCRHRFPRSRSARGTTACFAHGFSGEFTSALPSLASRRRARQKDTTERHAKSQHAPCPNTQMCHKMTRADPKQKATKTSRRRRCLSALATAGTTSRGQGCYNPSATAAQAHTPPRAPPTTRPWPPAAAKGVGDNSELSRTIHW